MFRFRNSIGIVLVLAASASCGGAARPSASPTPATPTGPTPTTPTVSSMTVSARCRGSFHPGDTVAGGCLLEVGGAAVPPVRAFADLRPLGGSNEAGLVQCPACGAPPWVFDVDLRIPAGMAPGQQTVTVWAIDAQGRQATTTAAFDVTPR